MNKDVYSPVIQHKVEEGKWIIWNWRYHRWDTLTTPYQTK